MAVVNLYYHSTWYYLTALTDSDVGDYTINPWVPTDALYLYLIQKILGGVMGGVSTLLLYKYAY